MADGPRRGRGGGEDDGSEVNPRKGEDNYQHMFGGLMRLQIIAERALNNAVNRDNEAAGARQAYRDKSDSAILSDINAQQAARLAHQSAWADANLTVDPKEARGEAHASRLGTAADVALGGASIDMAKLVAAVTEAVVAELKKDGQ